MRDNAVPLFRTGSILLPGSDKEKLIFRNQN